MAGSGKSRVLVVEDHIPLRRLIAFWLRKNGSVVFESGHASQAITWIRKHPRTIHLAIIDLVGTSGLDLAAEIGRDYHETQILYISGYVDSLAVEAIGWRAPETLLLKPFGEHALIERVNRLLAGRLPAGNPKIEPESERKAPPTSLCCG